MFFLRHFRSCGNTLEKCFFQISSYSCAHARIIYQRQLGIPLKQEAYQVSFKLLCTSAFVFFHRNASYLSACLLHRYFTQVRFHKWSTLSLTSFLTLRQTPCRISIFCSLCSQHLQVSLGNLVRSSVHSLILVIQQTGNENTKTHQAHVVVL